MPFERQQLHGGQLLLEISNGIIRIYRDCAGKGPSSCKAYWAGPDTLLVMMRGGFTVAEQLLYDGGHGDAVRESWHKLQDTLEGRMTATIAALTGSEVIARRSVRRKDHSCRMKRTGAGQGLELVPGEAAVGGSQTRRTMFGRAVHRDAGGLRRHVLDPEAIRPAPGTPSEQFVGVLKAANMTEFDHYRALRRIGARPQTQRYWIPDAAFGGGGAGLFESIEKVETIEISLYLVGVTAFTRIRHAFRSRLCAEALGTEAEHRVLARFARGALGVPVGAPNDVGFERYHERSTRAAKQALQALGIGCGRKGAEPGKFLRVPGQPAGQRDGCADQLAVSAVAAVLRDVGHCPKTHPGFERM